MKHTPASLVAIAAAAATFWAAGYAGATSCDDLGVVAPTQGAVGIPTNTLVWCSLEPGQRPAPIVMKDSRAVTISGTQTQVTLPGFQLLVFRPNVELAPNSAYDVVCPRRSDVTQPTSFETGAGPRREPPAVPDLSKRKALAILNDEWGASHGVSFDGVALRGTILVFDVGGGAALSPEAPSGSASDANVSDHGEAWVGSGPCGGNWPGATLGASTSLAMGAFDITGAFSGWSETIALTLPATYTSNTAGETPATPSEDEASPTQGISPPDAGSNGEPVVDDATSERRVLPGRAGCDVGALDGSRWGTLGMLAASALTMARRRARRR